MGEKLKKVLLSVLSLSMFITTWELSALNALASEAEYEIYPLPQAITYSGGDFVISKEINVVYDDTIDDVTKNRLTEIVDAKGITTSVSDEVKANVTNVLVGTNGSNGYVDHYFDENITHDEAFFDKMDSHIVSIEDKTIAILGKDTDASFYGLTSLKHILNQIEGRTIRNLRIDDFASTKTRGFIEGYYGIPWSDDDRISLMQFGGEFKMNAYIFAPKDDAYHSGRWRDPYPAERLAEMKRMVDAGIDSKCRFVWTIHPFMSNGITESTFEADIAKIITKFEQLYGIGVRQFGVLGDDSGDLPRSVVIRVMERLQEWVDSKGDVHNLVFCPAGYNNAWWKEGELDDYDQGFHEDIQIFWTGEAVCQPIEQRTLDNFKTRDLPAGASPRRSPLFWMNWPVNDINMKRLMMGKGSLLHTDVNVEDLEGVVTNPMQEAEASKVAIFAIADYAWNVKAFNDDKSWKDSFKYVDSDASEALYEMAKHLSDPAPNGHGLNLAESEELKPFLDDFRAAFDNGDSIIEKGNVLIDEFEKIIKACDDFDKLSKNEAFKEEINSWRLSLKEISEANIEFIQSAIALENNQNDEAVSHYTSGVAKFEASKNHIRYKIHDEIDVAEAGAKRIIPFTEYLNGELSLSVGSILDPSKVSAKVITNRTDTPSGSLDNLLDNNEGTEVVWKNPNSADTGTYIGVMYNQVIDIHDIVFKMAHAGNLRDTFDSAKLQYTADGKTWTDIAGSEYSDTRALVQVEGLNLKAKGVRIIATADKTNMWLGCRDIVVNGLDEGTPIIKGTPFIENMVLYSGDNLDALVDGNTTTGLDFLDSKTPSNVDEIHKDAAVGLEFDSAQPLGLLRLYQASGDKVTNAAIEYRVDGTWKTFKEMSNMGAEVVVNLKGTQADAVRIRNLDENTNKWWHINEIKVEEYVGAFSMTPMYSTDKMLIRSGSLDKIIDGSTSTNASFSHSNDSTDTDKDSTLADTWVGVEFDDTIEVGNVHISHGNGSNDKINKGVIEYRINGEWKTFQTLDSIPFELDVNLNGTRADAVRIRNSEKVNVWWQFNEISVDRFDGEIDDSVPISKTIIKTSTFGIWSGNETELLDGNDSTGVWYQLSGNKALVGDFIGLDLGRVAHLKSFHAAVGIDSGDKWVKYDLEYSEDNVNWTTFKSYNGVSSGQDIIDEDLTGIRARYVRLVNKQEKSSWVKFGEINVEENTSVPTNKYTYTNVTALNSLQGTHSLEQMTLLPHSDITLANGEYIGVKLERLKDLTTLDVDVASGLTLQISENGVIWTAVTDQNNVDNARYIRLINNGSSDVTFNLTKFIVNSNEIYELKLSEASGFTVSGDKNLFDKNRTSETVFQGSQTAGRFVTYDLGQVIDLNTFKVVSRDSNTDFPRHAKISVSEDGTAWEQIMTIGNQDGTANPGEAENTDTIQDVLPLHEISYNAKEAANLNVKARYIKFEITKTKVGADKWVRFTEFELNNNQTLATTTDPTVTATVTAQDGYNALNVADGNTATAFKPIANKAGSLLYKVTDTTNRNKITVLQSPTAISEAKIYAEVVDSTRATARWIELGNLNTALCEYTLPESVKHLLAVKIEWTADQEVAIQEILINKVAYVNVDKTRLNDLIRSAKAVNTDTWTTDSKENLRTVLEYAEATYANDFVSESVVNSAISKLDKALNQPELKGDLSAVRTLLNELKAIKNDDSIYVKSTFTKLQNAIQYAENEIKEADNISEADADMLVESLENARTQLVFSAIPKENLISAIEEISYELSLFDETLYPAEILQQLKDELKNAQDMVNASTATPLEYAQQNKVLTEAYQLADYAKDLKASIDKYDVITADSFTESTYAAFAEKLAAAKELLKTPTDSEAVQEALEALEEAYENLAFDMNSIAAQLNKFETEVLGEKTDYTTDSITPFEAIVNVVKEALADESTDKTELQAKLKEMMNRYAGLVSVKVLNAELKAFDKIDPEHYSADSYAAYEAVYKGLDIDKLKASGTQDEVNQAASDLAAARSALVEVASKKELAALIKQLEDVNADDYTTESYQKVTEVLTQANSKDTWLKDEFIELREAADDAILGLVDISELNKKLNMDIDASEYTEESYLVLSELLEQAKALKTNGTAEEIAAMLVEINKAIDNLVPNADHKNTLAEALKEAEAIDTSKYTEESVAELEKAIKEVKRLLADDHATLGEINFALAALESAIEGLEEKTIDLPTKPVKPNDKPSGSSDSNQTLKPGTDSGNTPNTGDNTNALAWLMLCVCGSAIMIISKKRSNQA